MAGIPKLVVLSEQFRGQSFELTEETYTIGRVEDCDICIPDPTVSTHHATLQREPDGTYRAIDEGSTNGSRVNGSKMEEQVLINSDILQIGGIEMLFDCEETRTAATSTQTVINLQDTNSGNVGVSGNMKNFTPFDEESKDTFRTGNNKTMTIVMWTIIGLLSAGVLVSLGILIKNMTSGQ